MRPIFFIALSLLVASCTHKSNDRYIVSGTYLILGHPGGFVLAGSHDVYYLLSNGQLRADTNVPLGGGPDDISKFNFSTVMPASKYDTALKIPAIPAELLSMNGQTIGRYIPDIGYLDVRTSVNGTLYRWSFAPMQDSSNIAIQQFVDSALLLFR